ncbi:MAG: hypothetical protein ACTSO7_03035 [Candidatus Heimdallarchaeota archaeon]
MANHTHIRYSWYIPLPQLYSHSELLSNDFAWLHDKDYFDKVKEQRNVITNFSEMRFDKLLTYPLLEKDNLIRSFVEIPFSPIIFLKTKQKKITYSLVNKSNAKLLFKENQIKSLKFEIRIYPIGFCVISAYVNYDGILTKKINKQILTHLKCGKKHTTLSKYVNYLKVELLKSLFDRKHLEKIKTISFGPKSRFSIIYNQLSFSDRRDLAEKLLGLENTKSMLKSKLNKKTNDHIFYNKQGLIFYSGNNSKKIKRKHFRYNLDFLIDLVNGAKCLISIIPNIITKIDIKNNYNHTVKLIANSIYSMNHEIIASRNDLSSILSSAMMRSWFLSYAETVNYSEIFNDYIDELFIRINEMRIDKWYEVMNFVLKDDIPLVTEKMLTILAKKNITARDILAPRLNLDENNQEILSFLLEKIASDYTKLSNNDQTRTIPKENFGYCTLNNIEKALKIPGRNHFNFKNRMNYLRQVGLLEAKAYTGPGSRKDSVQFRASPKHPYVNEYLKNQLTINRISLLNL